MERNLHPRIIGACVVGFALVAGAYVLSTFGQSNFENQAASVAIASEPRVAIAVTDNNNNGIEDWRDDFVTTEPIVLDPIEPSEYEFPTTLSGQLGINLIDDYIRSKNAGLFGSDQSEVVGRAVDVMSAQAVYDLYDTPDITIMSKWEDDDIRTYANTVALAILNNNVDGVEGEIEILSKATGRNSISEPYLEDLEKIATAYKQMRDDMLNIPVPGLAVKEHLDLINVYNALHQDISSMAIAEEDPALALIRIKRYQDDAAGLKYALENMYTTLEPYANLLQPEDPALIFVVFSSEFNS